MNPLAAVLRHRAMVVLDGALATELERRGCDLNDPLWSARVLLERPELILQVHADYFAAGADCAITASYQASVAGFARRGLSAEAAEGLIRRSVRLAVAARDRFWCDAALRNGRPRPFVAGSVGPYGAYLADGSEYRGDYHLSERELIEFHRPRLAALVAAGADILACETLPCSHEAHALLRLLEEFPEISAWFSFTACDDRHIVNGERLADVVATFEGHDQVAAIGINCTPPQYLSGLIREAGCVTRKPIVVYPNSGESYDAGRHDWCGESAGAGLAGQARDWYHAGARLIGGCCRTTPADIGAITRWARGLPTPDDTPIVG